MKRLLFILGIILLCTVLNAQTSYSEGKTIKYYRE